MLRNSAKDNAYTRNRTGGLSILQQGYLDSSIKHTVKPAFNLDYLTLPFLPQA